jgi:aspartate aminotransferase
VKLSKRVAALRPSATLEVKMTAERLQEEGVDIIDFGPGEPDFDTPDNIKAAAHKAIDANLSHYLPTRGLRRLRDAVALYYKTRYGREYEEKEIIVGCGAKSVLYVACMAILSEGDEMIIPSPYWVSYPEQVRLAGGTPVILETNDGDRFIPRAEAAARLVTERTRAIILCSPSNPTGAVLPQHEVDRFVDLALERDLYLIYDECYENFHYDGNGHTTPARSPRNVKDRLLLVNSVSKSFAMTGYRVGYALGPAPLVAAMAAIQGHDTTHTAAVAQAAAAEALFGPKDSVAAMLREYTDRREVIIEGLGRVKGISCSPPAGAFYVFPRVTGLYQQFGVTDSVSLCRRLLEEARVAVVPGDAFGAPGYLRFSYALSLERIREGMERIRRCAG